MTKTRALILALAACAAPLSALAAPFSVPVDQARRLPFTGMAASVSPGNPAIADVNVIDERTILVVGKKPGITNLIVLDRAGRPLFDGQILVSDGDGSTITVSRGGATATYACAPYCQQTGGAASVAAAGGGASATATTAPAPAPVK